jgi:hypothetical protein
MRTFACLALLVIGCGDTSNPADMAAPPDMTMAPPDMVALCGKPGDTGNSVGIGKYCTTNGTECMGNKMATVCSAAFFAGTNFCTLAGTCTCPAGMLSCAAPANCAENTLCQCSTTGMTAGLCGCTPAACKL